MKSKKQQITMASEVRQRLAMTEHVEQQCKLTSRTTCQPSQSTLHRMHSANRQGWCLPETAIGVIVSKLLVASLAGVVFGWSLEKGRVFEPAQIRLQMIFQRFVMLKMFLTATAFGQLSMGLLSILPAGKDSFQRAVNAYSSCLTVKGALTSSLGPLLLGAGMTICGACPGTVLPQLGSQTKNSEYTLLGALLGALVYGLLAETITRIMQPQEPSQNKRVPESLGVPYIVLAACMAVLLLGIVYAVELLVPWDQDLDCWNRNAVATPKARSLLTLKSWPPYVAGALIGLLQVPIVLSLSDTVGGSSSFSTVVSQWVVTERLQRAFPTMAAARCGLANWWQVFFVSAAILGGGLSAMSSGSLATAQGVSAASAALGGFCILLGARLAGGCTSGHGISGMGLMYWLSFLAVPAMFGGAIVTAVIMHMCGTLTNLYCTTEGITCSTIPSMQC